MKKLILALLLIPTLALADSQTTIDGRRTSHHMIQDEGSSLKPRRYLNFVGDGVSAADSGNKTVVTISGGGGSGTDVELDLGNNGATESAALTRISTTGDTNSIWTEATPDQLLMDAGQNWPTADTANAGDTATAFFSSGQIELAYGGTAAALVDPNSDAFFGWDDSATSSAFFSIGTGLTVSATDISVTLGTSIAASEMADEDHGDVTWSSGVASVEDDSHAHGTGTITEADPTLTDDAAVTIGSGSDADVTLTFNASVGDNGTLGWDESDDEWDLSEDLSIGTTTAANTDIKFNTTGTDGTLRWYAVADAWNLSADMVIGGLGINPDGTFHVLSASAGTVTANTSYDDITVENSAAVGMTFLSPNSVSGTIAWGDPEDNDIGQLAYSHSDNAMTVTTNATLSATFSSSQGLDVVGGITANGNGVIEGDGTSGRVLAVLFLIVRDATDANEVKCSTSGEFNHTSISAVDNIGKGETVGDFSLSADGSQITIEVSGLSGNCVTISAATISHNTSGTDFLVDAQAISNDIQVTIKNRTTAAAIDFTSIIDTSKAINLKLEVILDA